MFGFLLVAIGLIIYPVGYNFLGKHCRGDDAEGCGLDCGSSDDRDFSYFRLCSPWKPGLAFLYGIIGSVFLMVSSIIVNCTQLVEKPDEYDDQWDPNESTA